jgi:hypothetical protein
MSPPDTSRQSEKPRHSPCRGFVFCIKGERAQAVKRAQCSRGGCNKASNCDWGFQRRTFVPFWLSLRADFRISRHFEFSGRKGLQFYIAALGSGSYNATMSNNSEVLILANGSSGSMIAAPEPSPQFLLNPCCLWCARTFTPRATGGSAQRFCCTGHRQQFWIAARRWTMRAIEAGLLSVDCLKASHTSVHAA